MRARSQVQLLVVMPVFNEQASVRKVVLEWFHELENWTEDFIFLALDDGSADASPVLLKRLKRQLGSRMQVVRHKNRGHGQTCLAGYREAVRRGIPWILQIDSDGQCDPQYFFRLWRLRESADVIYGRRKCREDGWRRKLASIILRGFLRLASGVDCADANVPYRLMRAQCVVPCLDRIPSNFFLANVALAVLLRTAQVRQMLVPIRFRERYGGEPAVPLSKFWNKACELYGNLKSLKSSASPKSGHARH